MTPILKGTAARLGLRKPEQFELQPQGPWTAVYFERAVEKSEEFDRRLHAIGFLSYGMERRRIAPVRLEAPDGTVALIGDQLHEELQAYECWTWT